MNGLPPIPASKIQRRVLGAEGYNFGQAGFCLAHTADLG